jgi:hypothetical protein
MYEIGIEKERITITKPGAGLTVKYRLDGKQLKLIYTSWMPINNSEPEVVVFRADALQLALAKARELGWIA